MPSTGRFFKSLRDRLFSFLSSAFLEALQEGKGGQAEDTGRSDLAAKPSGKQFDGHSRNNNSGMNTGFHA